MLIPLILDLVQTVSLIMSDYPAKDPTLVVVVSNAILVAPMHVATAGSEDRPSLYFIIKFSRVNFLILLHHQYTHPLAWLLQIVLFKSKHLTYIPKRLIQIRPRSPFYEGLHFVVAASCCSHAMAE